MNRSPRSPFRHCIHLAIAFAIASVTGCGSMDASDIDSDSDNLSAVRDADDCGRVMDPKKDRDHKFHKRCQRYRQKHGRKAMKAGSAQLTARALLDVTRAAELEATTGAFDDGSTPPGQLDELRATLARVDGRRGDGKSLVLKGARTGYLRAPLPSVVHGQSLSISARVSGIDKRTDVVEVQEQVTYRPDLAPGAIDVAPAPAPGVPTPIAIAVAERMGDEGAKADCVLSVDGAAVDRATGVWVDAGGLVTCHFAYSFAAGSHVVAVDVANVVPRDYDGNNNHVEAVVTAAAGFTYSGGVTDGNYSSEDVEDVLDAAGAVLYHRLDSFGGANQSLSLSGTWPTALTFPITSLTASASSGGASWPLFNVGAVLADPSDGSGTTCASVNDNSGYNWVGLCTTTVAGAASTQISISSFAGDVTYHSVGVCQTTSAFYDCAGGYTWNSGSSEQSGTRHPLVGSLAFALRATDAAGTTFEAAPSIPVAPYTSSSGAPRSCEAQSDGTLHCTSHSYVESGVSGSTP
jgi:hypothetical protein